MVINRSLKIKGKVPKVKTCNTLVTPDSTLHSIHEAPVVMGLLGVGIDVLANKVSIEGLVVAHAGEAGIRTDPLYSEVKLKNSVLLANVNGIYFHASGPKNNSVKSNCFYQNAVAGIRTRYGLDDATISKNLFFETAAAAAILIDQDPGVTNDRLTVKGNKSQGDSTFAVILACWTF